MGYPLRIAAATPSLGELSTEDSNWHPNTVWAAFIEGNNDYNLLPYLCGLSTEESNIVTSKQCVDSLLAIVIATLNLCGIATEDSNWTPVFAWILELKIATAILNPV